MLYQSTADFISLLILRMQQISFVFIKHFLIAFDIAVDFEFE
jgi:hypothetical protein